MKELNNSIEYYVEELRIKAPDVYDHLVNEIRAGVFISPFQKTSVELSALLSEKVISFEEFGVMKKEYEKRNKFLSYFEMSPSTFGKKEAESYLIKIVPGLKHASKELDPNYSKEYDCWYDGIKIEVKASRAVEKVSGGRLVDKALYANDQKPYVMNFQQIKPGCFDVVVFVAFWRDDVRFWVLSSSDVVKNSHYSGSQHRGNKGEGQLRITPSTITEFDYLLVEPKQLLRVITEKGKQRA